MVSGELIKEWFYKDIRCRILEGPWKNYNGYVGIPHTHPWWGIKYDKLDIDVHGGLTFGSQGEDGDNKWPDSSIYWYGFDTSHFDDYIEDDVYVSGKHKWTIPEMVSEIEHMAEQFTFEHCVKQLFILESPWIVN